MPSSHPNPPGFLRPYRPTDDSEVVLQLITESFRLKEDPEGMYALQQMRESARRQSEKSWFSPAVANQPGFVWEMDGQVVGNISIISFLDKLRHIALIANVAVCPEYQGRGIATALTKHALGYVKSKRAHQVWLQVSADNLVAKHMYTNLGFDIVRTTNQWSLNDVARQRPVGNHETPTYSFAPRRFLGWGWQKQRLLESYPADTRWYGNVEFGKFSPWSILNLLAWDEASFLHHFILREQGELAGVLSWQRGLPRSDALWLAFEQTPAEDDRIYALTAHFLEHHWQKRATRLEYPLGRGERALDKLGFRLSRRLDWMKLT